MIYGAITMTNFWPQGLDARQYDAETRESIRIHEEIKQLTARVQKLEKKK